MSFARLIARLGGGMAILIRKINTIPFIQTLGII